MEEESMSWKIRGDRYVLNNQYDHAESCFRYAVHLDPLNLPAWNNLGYTFVKMGKRKEAAEVKSRIEDLKLQQKNQEPKQGTSVFHNDIVLFFLFFATGWAILFLYWDYFGGSVDPIMGAAWSGIISFLFAAWVWAFFFLWDTEKLAGRVLALFMTAFAIGGILVAARFVFHRISEIR
jgi:tetratricopeptide (TPR) repeat protein